MIDFRALMVDGWELIADVRWNLIRKVRERNFVNAWTCELVNKLIPLSSECHPDEGSGWFFRVKKEERKKRKEKWTFHHYPTPLRTTKYSPPPEGWAFVGDEGSGWFFGRRKKKEKRWKTNYRPIITPPPKNNEIFPSSGRVALCRRQRVGVVFRERFKSQVEGSRLRVDGWELTPLIQNSTVQLLPAYCLRHIAYSVLKNQQYPQDPRDKSSIMQ